MHKTLFAAAALAAIAIGAPAAAETSGDNSAPAAKTSNEADTNKVVCRRVEAIGTRLASKRVCRTKGEWDAEAAANRQDLERSQTQRWKSD